MSSKTLAVKDPVYACFLISKGCKLVDITPYQYSQPKEYIFDSSATNSSLNAEFLGATESRVSTTWLDLKNKMDNLQDREDAIFNRPSFKVKRDGEENWLGQEVFVTSSQVVAAFLISRGAKIFGASEIQKGRSYLFAFRNPKAAKSLMLELLSGEVEETWYAMKQEYKHVTDLRHHFCKVRKKGPSPVREPQRLRASGTNG